MCKIEGSQLGEQAAEQGNMAYEKREYLDSPGAYGMGDEPYPSSLQRSARDLVVIVRVRSSRLPVVGD